MSNFPWGVHVLASMIGFENTTVTLDNGAVYRAVPLPYPCNWLQRIEAAWWVLTGRAEAVVWPDAGDLEFALKHRKYEP